MDLLSQIINYNWALNDYLSYYRGIKNNELRGLKTIFVTRELEVKNSWKYLKKEPAHTLVIIGPWGCGKFSKGLTKALRLQETCTAFYIDLTEREAEEVIIVVKPEVKGALKTQ